MSRHTSFCFKRFTICLLLAAGLLTQADATEAKPDLATLYNYKPNRFAKQIEQFEAADRAQPPPEGAVVAIGSSSMRLWRNIHEDLAPITIIHRGFGGSNLYDVIHYADRILLNYEPRAILLYEGDNDITKGISPETYIACFEAFVDQVHQALPDTRIYVLSIKPSIRRSNVWPNMQATNDAIEAICANDPLLTFIDVSTPMLDENGDMRPDIFVKDNIHMNEKGYQLWKEAVRPVLVDKEAAYENASLSQ